MLYTAPEQLRGGMATAATDQYALACAIYHCVAGHPPFVRETASALFGAHLFARPHVNETLDAPSNRAVRDALATGMAKEPEDRHRSCARLLVAASGHSAATTTAGMGSTGATGGAGGRHVAAGVGGVAAVPTVDVGVAAGQRPSPARSARTAVGELWRRLPAPLIPLLALAADAPVVAATAVDDALIVVAEDEIVALDAETARPRWSREVDDDRRRGMALPR
ncbi:MAG: hypothetical protein KY460_14710 [Actinobacteria bacterium]|nr:hypothetical protein [Actinomycetota bacterium]